MGNPTQPPPPQGVAWFPETISLLVAEMRAQRLVTIELIAVMRDVRDQLAVLLDRNVHDTGPHIIPNLEALTGGT